MSNNNKDLQQNKSVSWENFLAWEASSRDTIDFKKIYVDITDDLIAGLMLSQIVFWNLPGKNSPTKLRVKHDGKLWLAKRYSDWYDEIRITEKQARRALKILEEKGIIETALYKFDGTPTKHIRVKKSKFLEMWASNLDDYWILTFGKNGNAPKVRMESDERDDSITEITSKITSSSGQRKRTGNNVRSTDDLKKDDDDKKQPQKIETPCDNSFSESYPDIERDNDKEHEERATSSSITNNQRGERSSGISDNTKTTNARKLTELTDKQLRLMNCQPLSQQARQRMPAQFEKLLEKYEYSYIRYVISETTENLSESNGSKSISSANYFKQELTDGWDEWQYKKAEREKILNAVRARRNKS